MKALTATQQAVLGKVKAMEGVRWEATQTAGWTRVERDALTALAKKGFVRLVAKQREVPRELCGRYEGPELVTVWDHIIVLGRA